MLLGSQGLCSSSICSPFMATYSTELVAGSVLLSGHSPDVSAALSSGLSSVRRAEAHGVNAVLTVGCVDEAAKDRTLFVEAS